MLVFTIASRWLLFYSDVVDFVEISEKRFGKNRSLMTEVYESISLCYRKLGEHENAKLFCCKSVGFVAFCECVIQPIAFRFIIATVCRFVVANLY